MLALVKQIKDYLYNNVIKNFPRDYRHIIYNIQILYAVYNLYICFLCTYINNEI